MKRRVLFLVTIMTVIAGSLTFVARASPVSAQDTGVLWITHLVPCSLKICGGFPGNVATLGLEHGRVTVQRSGIVRITLHHLTVLSTGEPAAYKTLEVWVGSFTAGAFQGPPGYANPVGWITTDRNGNFSGTVDMSAGEPFAFFSGTTVAAQLVLNDPGIRSEFITGFTVP